MKTDNAYYFVRLAASPNKLPDIHRQLHADQPPASALWGAFRGVFGVPNNQVWCMYYAAEPPFGLQPDQAPDAGMGHATVLGCDGYQPTLRPASFRPLNLGGLYVFRYFVIAQDNLAEFLRLSSEAWQTFETAERFEAEPVGLFQPKAPGNEGSTRLLLITRYTDFSSWEVSRTADPAANSNFRRRAGLTMETTAYATSLIKASAPPAGDV